MLSRAQRSVLFSMFCVFVTACVAMEIYLIYSMIDKGFTNGKAVVLVLNGTVLYGCGSLFKEMVSKNFLKFNVLSASRLQRLASERITIIENARTAHQDLYATRRALITNTLKFAEDSLKGWVRGSHLELCVFVDSQFPLMLAYYDSNQMTSSRSMNDRDGNRQFYIAQNYEVIRILQAPTSEPRFILDTHASNANYAFTSTQQRNQVRSSVLLCLDLFQPCALVVSSNEKSAFRRTDSEVLAFVRFIGELIHFDLAEGDFFRKIREIRPDLF